MLIDLCFLFHIKSTSDSNCAYKMQCRFLSNGIKRNLVTFLTTRFVMRVQVRLYRIRLSYGLPNVLG